VNFEAKLGILFVDLVNTV